MGGGAASCYRLAMGIFLDLAIALAAGLLVGVERGWQYRRAEEAERFAGVRSFGLIGLLGGLWALLARELGEVLLGFAFLGFGAVVFMILFLERRDSASQGVTTLVAAMVTFALGALAVAGYQVVAAGGAVVTTVLLSLKPVLHRWVRRLEAKELNAALKLLLISVVLLPVLPDRGFGPWQALNPYTLWWMVVLIAALSFSGYVAMKAVGPRRGTVLTGLLGGLVSSTAVTLSLARLARRPGAERILAVGILVAAATMFPRVLVEVAVVHPPLLLGVGGPLAAMTLLAGVGAAWLWRRPGRAATPAGSGVTVSNPFELWPAVQFGLLLAAVMFLAVALRHWLGDAGVYLLAAASGLADVDAITLSLARMAAGDLPPQVAARGIVLAAVVNTLVKGLLAAWIGTGLGRLLLPVLGLVAAVGLAWILAGVSVFS